MKFDGKTFDAEKDANRLTGQWQRVYEYRVLPPLPSDQMDMLEAAE